ncbi:MAG: hypothetical protein ACW960_16230, partial [Candidatus Thorarchaeota archaeon]
DGEQIVPSTWVSASTQVQVPDTGVPGRSYGFQWWIDPSIDAYNAYGKDGQIIWVQPENDLIVVITSSGVNYWSFIRMYMIPAILPPEPTTTTAAPLPWDLIVIGGSVAVVVIVLAIVFLRRR